MAWLVLEDGKAFAGEEFGFWPADEVKIHGEVVFNTAISGYQEIITDLSYAGQILTFTNPQIGNSGWRWAESEAGKVLLQGIILRELSAGESSPKGNGSLAEFCRKQKIAGLKAVDTRALTRYIRKNGSMPGVMVKDLAAGSRFWAEKPRDTPGSAEHWAYQASTAEAYLIPGAGPILVVLDLGAKRNIFRCLQQRGYCLHVLPAGTPAAEIMDLNPRGLVLTGGPGDPAGLSAIIAQMGRMLGKLPILGIGLGHQLMARAAGADTYKLPCGHRGIQPVLNRETGRVTMTAQNHSYAVNPATLKGTGLQVLSTNLNDQSIEGLRHEQAKLLTVQYNPEAAPGPTENGVVFDLFARMVKEG